jgi:hypothetical protein
MKKTFFVIMLISMFCLNAVTSEQNNVVNSEHSYPTDTVKIVVDKEMIRRFNECEFDSTKNWSYMKEYFRTHTMSDYVDEKK